MKAICLLFLLTCLASEPAKAETERDVLTAVSACYAIHKSPAVRAYIDCARAQATIEATNHSDDLAIIEHSLHGHTCKALRDKVQQGVAACVTIMGMVPRTAFPAWRNPPIDQMAEGEVIEAIIAVRIAAL